MKYSRSFEGTTFSTRNGMIATPLFTARSISRITCGEPFECLEKITTITELAPMPRGRGSRLEHQDRRVARVRAKKFAGRLAAPWPRDPGRAWEERARLGPRFASCSGRCRENGRRQQSARGIFPARARLRLRA